jgi:hypothetical protein
MNEPYVKQYNKNGQITNPITPEKPHENFFPNKAERNKKTRKKNNKIPRNKRGVLSRLIIQQKINTYSNHFAYHINQN